MKEKFWVFFVISLFAVSIVFAAGPNEGQPDTPLISSGNENPGLNDTSKIGSGNENPGLNESGQGTGQGIETHTETQNQGENSQIMTQQQIQQGSYINNNGEEMQLRNENGITLRVGDAEAHSSLNLTSEQSQNRTQLKTKLSNGRNAEIKVMPDTASQTAIQRLQITNCNSENNCSIELKEVGEGENVRAAYELKVQKEVKVLGLFRTKMQVQAQIDAENGEVIRTNRPWWAFLSSQ